MSKVLPKELTSYDLLKTFAIITMIIDHVGAYFYPDIMAYRAIGRFSAPVWMFLIGYARTRDLSPRLWGGAIILTVSDAIFGDTFFQLTILWGMIIVRMVIDKVGPYSFSNTPRMIFVLLVLGVMYVVTAPVFDYGSLCLVMALLGYGARHYKDQPDYKERVWVYALCTAFVYGVWMILSFEFIGMNAKMVFFGAVIICLGLMYFSPRSYPEATRKIPDPVVTILQICGRRTLEIYVAHLLIFKIAAWQLGVEGHGLIPAALF